jgi:hypothetical protein
LPSPWNENQKAVIGVLARLDHDQGFQRTLNIRYRQRLPRHPFEEPWCKDKKFGRAVQAVLRGGSFNTNSTLTVEESLGLSLYCQNYPDKVDGIGHFAGPHLRRTGYIVTKNVSLMAKDGWF